MDFEGEDHVQIISSQYDNPKKRKFNSEIHILFVDYIKAFDRVHCRKLWEIMTKDIQIT
jgi:hypothetical protein